jgi:cell division protein FtsB
MFFMGKFISFFSKYAHKVNKYWIAVIVFLIITFFTGNSTIKDQIAYGNRIKQLEKEIEELKKDSEQKKKLLETIGDVEKLEEFAREQYNMTKPDEEVFIIR